MFNYLHITILDLEECCLVKEYPMQVPCKPELSHIHTALQKLIFLLTYLRRTHDIHIALLQNKWCSQCFTLKEKGHIRTSSLRRTCSHGFLSRIYMFTLLYFKRTHSQCLNLEEQVMFRLPSLRRTLFTVTYFRRTCSVPSLGKTGHVHSALSQKNW